MKTIIYTIPAIIYKSFDHKGVRTPYFRTIMVLVLILFFHAVHLALIFNLSSDVIMPWSSQWNRDKQWLYGALYFGALITIVALVFRKSTLEKIEVSAAQKKYGYVLVMLYLFLCLALLTALLIRSGVAQGKINV